MEILICHIFPNPEQPRTHFDEEALAELTASVATHGVLQPIAVRPFGDNWMIIAGERRWRAATAAGLLTMPVVVLDLPPEEVQEAALIENIQREDLNPIEEALAYQRLVAIHGSVAGVAKRVGKSRSAVSNAIRLLQLDPVILAPLSTGELSTGHGILLLQIKDPQLVVDVSQRVIAYDMTLKELTGYIADLGLSNKPPATAKPVKQYQAPAKYTAVLCPECLHEFEILP